MEGDNGVISLREHVEALFAALERAMQLADREREKAAAALREQQAAATDAGDLRLRDHIDAQVNQISAALESAELLERERIDAVESHIAAVKRELDLVISAAEKAIAKAETASEKRLESMNEWRGQSADRERSQEEQMAKLSASFLPREVAEAQFAELRTQLQTAVERLNKLA